MKTTLLLTLFLTSLLQAGILEKLYSFEADFTQKIDDKEKKVVTYTGKIYADKKLQKAKWSYFDPVRKDVYIEDGSVTVVEPELEQVIVRPLSDDLNIFTLIKNAKRIGKNLYEAKYNQFKIKLFSNGKDIRKLQYTDEFDNLVTINFSHQKYNQPIDHKEFEIKTPPSFDLITE